jgi:2-isopropylmalate synthase
MRRLIKIYDTTLRDGTQGEGVSFSMEDKVRLATRLDALGIHYIEGGWPGSNPKDLRFFRRMQDVGFKHAKLTAFSMTRRAGGNADTDANMQALVDAGAPVATIVGKSWDFHVTEALGTTREENLAMIEDTIAWLRPKMDEVMFDAEHFFDGFRANRDYALATLRAAERAGAHWLVLCDTNGGTLPAPLIEILREVKKAVKTPLGIHVHNDAECAVANSLAAVAEGVGQVQGTMNGFGERCGNANLVSVIPSLVLKLRLDCIPESNLRELRDVSRFVSELANRKPWDAQPYVGDSAFAHKGGMHVSAVLKHPNTYEHIDPAAVGNHRRVLISELAGKSNVLWKAREYGIDLDQGTPETRRILDRLKQLEDEGFQFEGAEASFELLMERALGRHKPYFELDAYRVIVEEESADGEPVAEATVRVRVKGMLEHTAAAGNGPVNALDHALRKALEQFYPNLREMRLLDYKVRILDESKGTAAKTRVLVTSGDERETWGTVGVADNIIEASWRALVDSVEYKLRADERRGAAS